MLGRIILGVIVMVLTIQTADVALGFTTPLIAQVPAVTEERWDWNSCSVRSEYPPKLLMRGCAGERAQLSFLTLNGNGGRRNFMVRVTDLTGPGGTITPSDWDFKWVKWWWQSGRTYYENDHTVWVPELLLHDWDLVRSDPKVPEVNEYPELPQDAPVLKPMDIPDSPIGYCQQVWASLHIPHNARAGTYHGEVVITAEDMPDCRVPVKLYIWPFELLAPKLEYSIFYRVSQVKNYDPPPISSELKTPLQMKNELRDMVEHGITNPAICAANVPLALGLRKSAGCDNRRVFLDNGFEGMGQDSMGVKLRHWGVKQVAVFGPNENTPEQFAECIPKWRASRKSGAQVWGFCNFDGFENYLQECDVVVTGWVAGVDMKALVRKLHDRGIEVYFYGCPQVGDETPEIYRRNFGVRTWALDADGVMDYAYQHVFGGGHAWDDFAVRKQPGNVYRSHMATYPTVDGAVSTLAWEGWAAAVNDVRYLTTLEAAIAASGKPTLRRQANAFLDSLREEAGTLGLDAMRQQCAQWIVRLQK